LNVERKKKKKGVLRGLERGSETKIKKEGGEKDKN
jgi:hypothetical protein